MQLLFILTSVSWICQPLMSSEKFSSMQTQWEDMEIHHSFIQFMDLEEFPKAFQELVLFMVLHSCSTPISMKFFFRVGKLSESKMLKELLIVQWLFAIQPMLLNAALKTESK
jgi:hypothetical protein